MVLKFVHRGTKNQVLLVKDNSYKHKIPVHFRTLNKASMFETRKVIFQHFNTNSYKLFTTSPASRILNCRIYLTGL